MSACDQTAAHAALVLIVDDEPQIRGFLTTALADAGFEVCAAEDGVSALEVLRTQRPAAIVTDLMMPRMDGWELCRRLRANANTASTPLVVISALQAADVPGDAFLSKPFDLDALLVVLRRLTSSCEAPAAAAQRPARLQPRPGATAP